MYHFETHLVEDFKRVISSNNKPFKIQDYATEFNYNSGRTDIIAKTESGKLIAFEAKLIRWEKAINQAYRNSSFAHYSYVLLPKDKIQIALSNVNEFKKRGIGLCSFTNEQIEIHIKAPHNMPFQPWLTSSAINFIKVTNG